MNVFVTNGSNGSLTIADTATYTATVVKPFRRIYVVATANISALTGNATGLTGISLAAGQSFDGVFTSIALASGTVTLYY